MIGKLFLLISIITSGLQAFAMTTNYFCLQSSLEPNSVYVLGSTDSIWTDAAKVTSKQKIEDSDLNSVGEIVFKSDLEKILSNSGDFLVEPMEILISGKSQTRKNLLAYVGINNFVKIYSFTKQESSKLQRVMTIQSTEFKFDSVKRTVNGWSNSSSENDKTTGTITQMYCGTQSNS